jgi:hypothetical protein
MTDQRIITFVQSGKCHFAFLGVHLVGAVRDRVGGPLAGEWIFCLPENQHGVPVQNWRGALDIDAAKQALIDHAADWYDAAHQPLAPGQAERLARYARVG